MIEVKGYDHSANATILANLANYSLQRVDFDLYTCISNHGEENVTLTL